MFSRSRYIHQQVRGDKFHGFSVLLEPAQDPDSVNIRVTFCSHNDQFCKRTARETLAKRASFPVPVANLPRVLYGFQAKCDPHYYPSVSREGSNRWSWIWKYFL